MNKTKSKKKSAKQVVNSIPVEQPVRWGSIIPLIGGSSIGCAQASGTFPLFQFSYSPFAKNEEHIQRYWPNIPFYYLDKFYENGVPDFTPLDFVTSVCPCAGLSMLNTAKNSNQSRGSDAEQNKWMFDTTHYVLNNLKPKVFFGENAPGLFTDSGQAVVDELKLIGSNYGYSFSLVKTNTELHGIPQRRIRTFYFFWNTPKVPFVSWKKKRRKTFPEYLKEIPADASCQDIFMVEGVASEMFRPYEFVLEREGLTHAQFFAKIGKTTICQYLQKYNLIDECIEWLRYYYPNEGFSKTKTFIDILEHQKNKISMGKGFWDDSPRFFGSGFNCLMKKSIMAAVHPTEDRFLNAREMMHLMGLPHDFEIEHGKQNINHIAQNVPVATAQDWADEVVKFCRGECEMTEFTFMKQDNMKQEVVYAESEDFFGPVPWNYFEDIGCSKVEFVDDLDDIIFEAEIETIDIEDDEDEVVELTWINLKNKLDAETPEKNRNNESECKSDESTASDESGIFCRERFDGGGRRESRNKYSLEMKIAAIAKMQAGKIASIVSADMGVPVGVISQWWLARDDIKAVFDRKCAEENGEDEVEDHIQYVQEKFNQKRMEKFLTVNPDTVEVEVGEPSGIKDGEKLDMLSDDSIEDKDFLDKDSEFIQDMGLDSDKSSESSGFTPGDPEEPGSSKKKKRKSKNGELSNSNKRQKTDSPNQNGRFEKTNGKKSKKEVKTTTYEVKEGRNEKRYEVIHKSMSPEIERVPGEIRMDSHISPRRGSPTKNKVSPYLPQPPKLSGSEIGDPLPFKNILLEDVGSDIGADLNGGRDMLMSTIEVNGKPVHLKAEAISPSKRILSPTKGKSDTSPAGIKRELNTSGEYIEGGDMPDAQDEPIKILEKVDKSASKKRKTKGDDVDDDDDKSSIVNNHGSTTITPVGQMNNKHGDSDLIKLEVTDHSVDRLMTSGDQMTPQPPVLQKVFLTSTPKSLKETPKLEVKTEPVDLRKVSSSMQTDTPGGHTANFPATATYATPAQQSTNHFPAVPFSQALPRTTMYTQNKISPQNNRQQPYQQYPTAKGPSPRGRKVSPLVTKAQPQAYQHGAQTYQPTSYAQVLSTPVRGGRGRPSLNHIGGRGVSAAVQNARGLVQRAMYTVQGRGQTKAVRGQIVSPRGRGQIMARGRGVNLRGGIGRGVQQHMQPQANRRGGMHVNSEIQVVGAVMKTTPQQQRMPISARGAKSGRGGRVMNNIVRQPINSHLAVPAQSRLRANARAPLVRGSPQMPPARGVPRGMQQRGPQPRMAHQVVSNRPAAYPLNPVIPRARGKQVPYNVPRGRGQNIRASPVMRGSPVMGRGVARMASPQVSRGGRAGQAGRGAVMGQRTPIMSPPMGRGVQRVRNPGQQQYRGQMPANLSTINGLSVSRPRPAALPKGVRIPTGISMSHPLGIQGPHSANQSLDGRSSPKRRVSMELSDRQMEALKNLGLM